LAGVQEKLTTIEAEKAKVTEELGGIKASLQTQSGRAATLQKQLLAMTEERDTLKQQAIEQRTASEQLVQGLNTRLSQLERELSLALEKGKTLEAVRVGQVQQMAACEDRNAKLYAVGRSVVDECRDRSARDTSLRLEPFTGIARVEIENRLETQRDQLDAQKSQPANSAK
jgi:chromosome segregation ATPase